MGHVSVEWVYGPWPHPSYNTEGPYWLKPKKKQDFSGLFWAIVQDSQVPGAEQSEHVLAVRVKDTILYILKKAPTSARNLYQISRWTPTKAIQFKGFRYPNPGGGEDLPQYKKIYILICFLVKFFLINLVNSQATYQVKYFYTLL